MSERSSRQAFLGPDAENTFAAVRLGIVGVGGGGSHVLQQAAHIGFQKITVFDFDRVEESNLNRLVGGTVADAQAGVAKGAIAIRLYRGLQASGDIIWCDSTWQDARKHLRECDLVITCLDDLPNRLDIEKTCRRYLIPMIDIGMDIKVDGSNISSFGQVAISMPGHPCLQCLGFHDVLVRPNYGDAGHRPQVVWSNGILASTAIGLAVEILTNWTRRNVPPSLRFDYDGRNHSLKQSPDLERRLAGVECPHIDNNLVGDP